MAKRSEQLCMSIAFIEPTLPMVTTEARLIGLPETEGQKFYHFHCARGWMMGKVKMKRWKSALQVWRLNWQERQPRETNPDNYAFERDGNL